MSIVERAAASLTSELRYTPSMQGLVTHLRVDPTFGGGVGKESVKAMTKRGWCVCKIEGSLTCCGNGADCEARQSLLQSLHRQSLHLRADVCVAPALTGYAAEAASSSGVATCTELKDGGACDVVGHRFSCTGDNVLHIKLFGGLACMGDTFLCGEKTTWMPQCPLFTKRAA